MYIYFSVQIPTANQMYKENQQGIADFLTFATLSVPTQVCTQNKYSIPFFIFALYVVACYFELFIFLHQMYRHFHIPLVVIFPLPFCFSFRFCNTTILLHLCLLSHFLYYPFHTLVCLLLH